MNKLFDHMKNIKDNKKNLLTDYHWNFQKKTMWRFDILNSFDLSRFLCYMISNQNNNHEFDCFHINIKKNQHLKDTQIKIRFYDSFHHLNMLLCCDSVCNEFNTDHLMTSRHKWLIVELEFNGQFFFSWKVLYDESECLIVQ